MYIDGFVDFGRQPNDNVLYLSDLYFGKSLYEEIVFHPPTSDKNNERYWERSGKNWRLRQNWRDLLPRKDPFARKKLYIDPSSQERCVMWEPRILMKSMTGDPLICERVISLISSGQDASSNARSKLESAITAHFYTVHKPMIEVSRGFPMPERHVTLFQNYVDRIAGAVANHFQVFEDAWMQAIMDSSLPGKMIGYVKEEESVQDEIERRQSAVSKTTLLFTQEED